MVEEQRLDRALEQVDQIVVPPHVRQLVGQNRVELRWREAGQHAGRHDDRRTDPTDERRHVDERRLRQHNPPNDAKAFGRRVRAA